jgi:hypothetical protein
LYIDRKFRLGVARDCVLDNRNLGRPRFESNWIGQKRAVFYVDFRQHPLWISCINARLTRRRIEPAIEHAPPLDSSVGPILTAGLGPSPVVFFTRLLLACFARFDIVSPPQNRLPKLLRQEAKP